MMRQIMWSKYLPGYASGDADPHEDHKQRAQSHGSVVEHSR